MADHASENDRDVDGPVQGESPNIRASSAGWSLPMHPSDELAQLELAVEALTRLSGDPGGLARAMRYLVDRFGDGSTRAAGYAVGAVGGGGGSA